MTKADMTALAKQRTRAAVCLRSYAATYARLDRDIADDFLEGAKALDETAAELRARASQEDE